MGQIFNFCIVSEMMDFTSDGLWHWIVIWYLFVSLFCFGVYAFDKSAAIAGRRRVSERKLLSWGVLGGWPGAILAQQLLRHKTKKPMFRLLFWLSVIVNLVALFSAFFFFVHQFR